MTEQQYPGPNEKPGREPGVTLLLCGWNADGLVGLITHKRPAEPIFELPADRLSVFVQGDDGVYQVSRRAKDIQRMDGAKRDRRARKHLPSDWPRQRDTLIVSLCYSEEFPIDLLPTIRVRCPRCKGVTAIDLRRWAVPVPWSIGPAVDG